MKTLTTYLNECSFNRTMIIEALTEVERNNMSLQDVYEAFFDELYANNMINEGLFSSIGNALKKLGQKSEDFDTAIGEKTGNIKRKLSDAATKAIEYAKQKAGNAWDSVKGVYTSVVSAIDSAIEASKNTITNLAKQFKVKVEEIEAGISNVYTKIISTGSKLGQKILEWTKDSVKFAAQLSAGTILITGIKVAMTAGYTTEMITDLLSIAGVKSNE